MKKQWFVLPLLLVATELFAQEVAAQEATVQEPVSQEMADQEMADQEMKEPAPAFAASVEYTYVKGGVTYASPKALFDVQGADAQSGLERIFVSVDNGEFAPYKGPISFTAEGPHSLAYRFIDKVSNISDTGVLNIYVDAAAPRVLDAVFSPDVYYASGKNYVGLKNEISFRYFDDLTGIGYLEFAAGTNSLSRYSAPFTPESQGLTESGPFVLSYQALDMVSNVTALKTMGLYLDAQAPVVNVFAKAVEVDGIRYISPRDVIQVEAFDAETKVKEILYSINDGEFTNYDAAIGIRITTPGEYDVKAKAVDFVGNVSEETVYSVVVDGLAPAGEAAFVAAGTEEKEMMAPAETEPADMSMDTPAEVPADDMPADDMPPADIAEDMGSMATDESMEVPADATAPVAR